TAGHCMTDVQSCRDYDYVFAYAYVAADALGLRARSDVFGCRQVAIQTVSPPNSTEQIDFAIIELDRGASRPPAPMGDAGDLGPGDRLTVVGFPSGLPAKIDRGAAVVDARGATLDYFSLTSDTFRGSSGSAVYDASPAVVGVFARGTTDFVDRAGCRAERTLPSSSTTSGELAMYTAQAIQALCAASWPSTRLCGIAPRCGDGVCSASEDSTTCPADCQATTCGDDLCEAVEWASCPADCGDRRPAGLPDDWY